MKYTKIILVLFFVILYGCLDEVEVNYGSFPETPVNFESINSEFDDFNSAAPYNLYRQFIYLFSSNRSTEGNEFNIENFIVEFYYLTDANKAVFEANSEGYMQINNVIEQITTSSNEFGPYITSDFDYRNEFIFYATDSSGNLDIGYVDHDVYETDWSNPQLLSKINTENNEAYPSFSHDKSQMYYCSDVGGNYDLFSVSLGGSLITEWLVSDDIPVKENLDVLNSSLNDKCPYILGNIMVFTSDREGGYGGYDLYYSELTDEGWSDPVNFGDEINTEYDEYRPITIYAVNYTNDLMFFSSNRPGGKGGFDLYYVGIPKIKF